MALGIGQAGQAGPTGRAGSGGFVKEYSQRGCDILGSSLSNSNLQHIQSPEPKNLLVFIGRSAVAKIIFEVIYCFMVGMR